MKNSFVIVLYFIDSLLALFDSMYSLHIIEYIELNLLNIIFLSFKQNLVLIYLITFIL